MYRKKVKIIDVKAMMQKAVDNELCAAVAAIEAGDTQNLNENHYELGRHAGTKYGMQCTAYKLTRMKAL